VCIEYIAQSTGPRLLPGPSVSYSDGAVDGGAIDGAVDVDVGFGKSPFFQPNSRMARSSSSGLAPLKAAFACVPLAAPSTDATVRVTVWVAGALVAAETAGGVARTAGSVIGVAARATGGCGIWVVVPLLLPLVAYVPLVPLVPFVPLVPLVPLVPCADSTRTGAASDSEGARGVTATGSVTGDALGWIAADRTGTGCEGSARVLVGGT
jgi:DNA-binding transcriptional LysR family regulator